MKIFFYRVNLNRTFRNIPSVKTSEKSSNYFIFMIDHCWLHFHIENTKTTYAIFLLVPHLYILTSSNKDSINNRVKLGSCQLFNRNYKLQKQSTINVTQKES